MDVDGIEHFILNGGSKVLKKVQSILIEKNDYFKNQSEETNHYLLKQVCICTKKSWC
jgi:hypothetical protein